MSEHKVIPLPTPSAEEHDAFTVGKMKRLLKESGTEKLFLIEGGDTPIMTVAVTGKSNILAVLQALHHHDLIDAEEMGRIWNAAPKPVQA